MNSAIPSWFSSIFFASQKKPLFLLRFCYWTNNIELLWISGVCVAESAENKSITESENFVVERPKGISYKFTLYYKKLICWREYYFEVQRLNFWWYRDNLSIDMWCDEKKTDFLHDIQKLEIELLFSIIIYDIKYFLKTRFYSGKKNKNQLFLRIILNFDIGNCYCRPSCNMMYNWNVPR